MLALLIWSAEPLLCQRFLSLYFVFAAALYIIDVVDGSYAINRFRWPQPEMRGTDAVMTRVMVIYNLAMVLANEALIQHASQTTWLLYFGLLPLVIEPDPHRLGAHGAGRLWGYDLDKGATLSHVLPDLAADKSGRACLPPGRRESAPAQSGAPRFPTSMSCWHNTPCSTALGLMSNEPENAPRSVFSRF